jgi:site-specific DNA recombinase
MNNVILYTRVSTDEQNNGYSPLDQKEKLLAYSAKNDLNVIGIYHDDASAKSFDRPEWKKIRHFIKTNKGLVNKILFLKWDRFSRNQTEALIELRELNKLGVELCAIEQMLDLKVPESKIMLAIMLSAPEVDNDRRSLNVFNGMRRGKMEGRWMGNSLRGYKNARDERNKPIMVPEGGKQEQLIRKAFNEFALGTYNIEDLRRKLNQEGLNISRSAFNKLLKNRGYTGYILVPAFESEKETWVKGLHTGLVDLETFEKVQNILEGRIYNKKPNKYQTQQEELPLRGLLICPQCNRIMTGSGSRGKMGNRFFYYHCQSGCRERQRASLVNLEMETLLSELRISENVSILLEEMIKEKLSKRNHDSKKKKVELESKILEKNNKLKKLQMLFLEDELSKEEYQEIRETLKKEIYESQSEFNNLQQDLVLSQKDLSNCLGFFQNIDKLYTHGDVSMKQTIVSSIFSEKLIFSEKKYRTPKLSKAASLIFNASRAFDNLQQKKHTKIDVLSCVVAPKGIEPLPKVPETFVLSIKLRSQFYGRAKV